MYIPFRDNNYNIIYADPPWQYDNKNTGWNMKSGASHKYETMSLKQLKGLPISDITEKDCCLFLWATVPMLPEALEVMKSWKFRYKTMLTWRKLEVGRGLGYWFRGECEHLLFGIKGNIRSFLCQETNFIQYKVLEHSEKPHLFRKLIERATNKIQDPKRIELFARQKIYGWDAWGNQVKEIQRLEQFLL